MLLPSKSHAGFTLVELLITISIIGVLVVIGVISYTQTTINSRDAKRQADLQTVAHALVLYKTDTSAGAKGKYPNPYNHAASLPAAMADFKAMLANDLQAKGFLNDTQSIVDPKDGTQPYGYRYVSANGTLFQVCARLEKTGAGDYCINNP